PQRSGHVLAGLRRARREIRRLRRRAVRGQRTDVLQLERRRAPPVRKVAQDPKPSQRAAAGGARRSPERVNQEQPSPIENGTVQPAWHERSGVAVANSSQAADANRHGRRLLKRTTVTCSPEPFCNARRLTNQQFL